MISNISLLSETKDEYQKRKISIRPSIITNNNNKNNNLEKTFFSNIDNSNLTRQSNKSKLTIKTNLPKNNIILMKIIIIGDVFVGKTSILKRLKYDTSPNLIYQSTTSIDFISITFKIDEEGGQADALVWDTCGSERFRSITKTYFKDVNGVIVVFDVSNRKSFNEIPNWINDLKSEIEMKKGELITPILIAGNKSDVNPNQRQVSFVEADNYCRQLGLKYYETSAMTGYNINTIFEELALMIIEKIDEKTLLLSKTYIEYKGVSNFSENTNNLSNKVKDGEDAENIRESYNEVKKGCGC
jgi:small GTP-binding protein